MTTEELLWNASFEREEERDTYYEEERAIESYYDNKSLFEKFGDYFKPKHYENSITQR